ncbi:MAG: hypothetical protein ACPGWM_05675 [Flavobacteriales bacterium]
MKSLVMLVSAAVVMATSALKPISNEYVLVHGNVKEMQLDSDQLSDAKKVRCVVYKDGEIYVAFNTDEDGDYNFNLPVGEDYEMVFGGDTYVNKRITLDVTSLEAEKKGIAFKCDMRVFKSPGEVKQLEIFKLPVAKFAYNSRTRKVQPDLEYLDDHSFQVEKAMRKIAKAAK